MATLTFIIVVVSSLALRLWAAGCCAEWLGQNPADSRWPELATRTELP